jgi:hypothetical protein
MRSKWPTPVDRTERTQLETDWLRTKRIRADGSTGTGSGGVAYLIKPWWKPWPKVADQTW